MNLDKGLLLTVVSIAFIPTCYADGFESIERVAMLAKNFVMSQVQLEADEIVDVSVNQANIPMQLTACTKELETAFPKNVNMEQINSVQITCSSDKPWQIFVPVHVDIATKVVVAKRPLVAKDPITADDLDLASVSKKKLFNGYYKDPEEIIGKIAAHSITSGAVITKKNTQAPMIVYRNQTINLIVKRNAVSISMKGIAKADAGLNETVKVFNPSSKRILDAMVVGPNQAEIIG